MNENKKNKKKSRKGDLIVWAVFFVIFLYVLGHLSGVVNTTGSIVTCVEDFGPHFLSNPLDCFHFNPLIFGFGVLAFMACFFLRFFRIEKPEGDMKGMEYGSSHFQSEEELEEFKRKAITDIYDYDFVEPKFEVPGEMSFEEVKKLCEKKNIAVETKDDT